MRSTAFEDFRALVIFRPVSWGGSCAFHLLFYRLLLEFHSIVVRFKRLASCHECIHPDWIGLRRRRKLFSPGLKNTLPAFGKAKQPPVKHPLNHTFSTWCSVKDLC